MLNRQRERTLPHPTLRLPLPPAPRVFNTPVSVAQAAAATGPRMYEVALPLIKDALDNLLYSSERGPSSATTVPSGTLLYG